MATRKRPSQEKNPDDPSLSEILSDSSDSVGNSYALVDSLAILRLIYCVSSLGGMVTFWRDSNNQRLCFSMRLWGEVRSYNFDHAAEFVAVSEPLVEKLSKVLATKKLPPPPPPTPLHLVPKPDK